MSSQKQQMWTCVVMGALVQLSFMSAYAADFESVRVLYQSGAYDKAIVELEELVKETPGNLMYWKTLARALRKQENNDRAMKIWRNIVRIESSDAGNYAELGEIESLLDPHAAILTLRQSLQLQPQQLNVHLMLGRAFENLHQEKNAAAQYHKAIKAFPQADEPFDYLARLHENRGEITALKLLRDLALKRLPGVVPTLNTTLARMYGKVGDEAYQNERYEVAIKAYRKGLHYEANNYILLTNIGWAEQRLGKISAALATWRQALALDPSPSPSLLRAIGDAALETHDFSGACAIYKQALDLSPYDEALLLHYGEALLLSNKLSLMSATFNRLLQDQPDVQWGKRVADMFWKHDSTAAGVAYFEKNTEKSKAKRAGFARLLSTRAMAAYREGRYSDAVADNLHVLDIDPNNESVMRDLGWAYWQKGEWSLSEAVWRNYVELKPESSEAHGLMAHVFLHQRNYQAAITEAQKAIRLQPEDKSNRTRLMHALLGAGQVEEARTLASRLAREFHDDVGTQRLYAQMLSRIRDPKAAQNQWRHVLELDPKSDKAAMEWLQATYALSEFDTAINEAQKRLHEQPSSEALLNFLADDALARFDDKAALTFYQRLSQLYPHQIQYWRQMVTLHQRLGQFDEAVEISKQALTHIPDNLELKLIYAGALLLNQDGAEALQLFSQLARENPSNRVAYRGMINSLMNMRDFKQALNELEHSQTTFLSDYEAVVWRAGAQVQSGDNQIALQELAPLREMQNGMHAVPVLVYHGIADAERSPHMSTRTFTEHMEAVVRGGFTAISLAELSRMVDGEMAFPKRPIIITFDDARSDSFEEADPILKKLGLKATVFVPTDMIGESDMYYASWKTLQHYAATGRWEMQAHGHKAHEPLALDEQGHYGRFLIDLAWRDDVGRLETPTEFGERLKEDYQQCNNLLQSKLGAHASAYAYPFNEMGQLSGGTANFALSVNEELSKKYFRFGMVQDSSGYNVVREGEKGFRLLWRFEPPRRFSGKDLFAHLNGNDPANAAQIQTARVLLASGQRDEAHHTLEKVKSEQEGNCPECERVLAELAWSEDRPRDSQQHLDQWNMGTPGDLQHSPTLYRRIAWANEARTSLEVAGRVDSNGRSIHQENARFTYPFSAPVDLEIEAGHISLDARNMGQLNGAQVGGSLAWAINRHFDVSAWGRWRDVEGQSLPAGGGRARFVVDTHELQLRIASDNMPTAEAIAAGIDSRSYSAIYNFNHPRWRSSWQWQQNFMTDQNRIDEAHIDAYYRPLSVPGLELGSEVERFNGQVASPLYYSPPAFVAARARSNYQHTFASGSFVSVGTGVGVSHDDFHFLRLTGIVRFDATKTLGPHWQTSVGIQLTSTNGYKSSAGQLTLAWKP